MSSGLIFMSHAAVFCVFNDKVLHFVYFKVFFK